MKKRDILGCGVSALLLIFSYPNFDFGFLAWGALVPLFYVMEEKTLKTSFKLGFLTGLFSFVGILYWIIIAVHRYGNIPLIPSILILLLLVCYLSLYVGAFVLLIRFLQMSLGIKFIIFAPFLWVALEYLRSFLLTGFPWANLSHSQYLNLPFIQMTEITGVYGLSFAIVMVNLTVYSILRQWPKKTFPTSEVAISILVLLIFYLYGYVRINKVNQQIDENPSLTVGIVQGNIDQSIKWEESFQKETLNIYERLSFQLAEKKPDLILWPETATPFFFQDATEYQPFVLNIPKKTEAFLLFGTPSYKVERGKIHHYNSALLVSPSGEVIGKYDKIHLVPYGEYVPLGDYIPLGSLGEGIGNFKPGKEIYNFSLPQGKFGVLICFEIIFPDLCRKFVKKGANFLVTITNDAWFGKTSAPYQHLAIAIFRAVENRVFIARAANTGISAFIDPTGRIIKQSGLFTEETLVGRIRLSGKKTFYTRFGDLFALLCSTISILLIIVARAKSFTLKPGRINTPRKKLHSFDCKND